MKAWADDYFGTDYAGGNAQDRYDADFNAIMSGTFSQVFRVPTESVVSLIHPPGDSWPIDSTTVEAASIALLRDCRDCFPSAITRSVIG
jgi:hypothetical protein